MYMVKWLLTRVSRTLNGERIVLKKWCREIWIAIFERRKPDSYLPPYTKLNSKRIKDLNVKPTTMSEVCEAPWFGRIPHAVGKLRPCTATTEPTCCNYWTHVPEPEICSSRSRHSEKPKHCSEERHLLAATRESPCKATKTQCSQKQINGKKGIVHHDQVGFTTGMQGFFTICISMWYITLRNWNKKTYGPLNRCRKKLLIYFTIHL